MSLTHRLASLAAALPLLTGCMASGSGYMVVEPASQPAYAGASYAPPAGPGPVYAESGTTTVVPSGTAVTVDAQNGSTVVVEYADTDPRALTDFRAPLEPYGTWVDDGTYGTVWVPRAEVVGSDFAPYVSSGHWTYGDDYVWVSDYSWGAIPFHYGRWVWIADRGWSWIPGRQYRGAWVSWRTGPDGYGYVGWAPMAPSWYWMGGSVYYPTYYPPAPYVFCPTGDLFHGSVGGRIVRGPAVATIGSGTSAFGGRTVAAPSVDGSGRTVATPSVGPAPNRLGIPKAQVTATPMNHQGLMEAQSLARPRPSAPSGAFHGSGFTGVPTRIDHPVAVAPSFVGAGGVAVAPRPVFTERPVATERPAFSAPRPESRPSFGSSVGSGFSRATPSFTAPRPSTFGNSGSSPSFHSSSTPSFGNSTPTFRSPSSTSSSPSFRSPSVAPSFRPSTPSTSTSRPSVRPSSSSTFRRR